jgi:hypothetical protein
MFQKITESTSLHNQLEHKTISQLLIEMNEEDQQVPLAVAKAIPQIEMLVEMLVDPISAFTAVLMSSCTCPRGTASRMLTASPGKLSGPVRVPPANDSFSRLCAST